MKRPTHINVTEQSIDVSSMTESEWHYYEALATELVQIYLSLGQGRKVFSLAGPSGAGKSVVAELIKLSIEHASPETHFIAIGIDGYHYPNAELENRELKQVKGRFDTYDTSLLQKHLSLFKAGEALAFPQYSRTLHEPVAESISVTEPDTLLLIEGLWLHYQHPDWERIRSLFDFTMELSGNDVELKENVIQRHVRGGRTEDDAKHFFTTSDQRNNELVRNHSHPADKKVLFYKDLS